MTELFGRPIADVMYGVLVLLAISLVVLVYIGWRHPLLLRLGIRNITRRPSQTLLIVIGIAGSIWLLRQANGIRRVALLTMANLALNLAFFFTYPIATPYYTIPISLLTLWTLLFAVLFVAVL